MGKKRTISNNISIGKFLSVCLMICSLSFLTVVNYFLYADDTQNELTITYGNDANENSPPAPSPTEEKSSNAGFSILEEMIHEHHLSVDLAWFNKIFLHKVTETENVEMGHYKLFSPPPEV